jgi:hypothetical protein
MSREDDDRYEELCRRGIEERFKMTKAQSARAVGR